MGRCPEEVTRAPGCEGLCDSALSLESCGRGGASHHPSFQVAHVLAWRRSACQESQASKRAALVRRREEGSDVSRDTVDGAPREGGCRGRNGTGAWQRFCAQRVSPTRDISSSFRTTRVCQRHGPRTLRPRQDKLCVGSSRP